MLSSFLRKIYQGFDTSNSIEAGAWREALRIIDKAAAEGVSQSAPSHEEDFLKELHRGNEIFAAFKVHSAGVQMAAKLLDEEGRLKPFDKWKSDVQSIASHQVGSWLHTEYDTAVLRAHYAADWRQFERDSDVMPNLRWMPTTSPNPEGAHKEYWSRKLTLPVGDSFWQRHHPQDRWNCKCSLEQTDDPVTEADEMDNVKTSSPQAGLDNNPGRDGRLFSDSHPYFPKSCAKCPFYKPSLKGRLKTLFVNQKKDCYNCPYARGCVEATKKREEFNKFIKLVRKEIQGTVITNPAYKKEVGISGRSIKEWTNQPHEHYDEKNRMILDISNIYRNAKYLGRGIDIKKKAGSKWIHLFEVTIKGEKSWIIVKEYQDGKAFLYSISDSPKVLNILK